MKNHIEQIGDDAFVHTRDGAAVIDAADIPLVAPFKWTCCPFCGGELSEPWYGEAE